MKFKIFIIISLVALAAGVWWYTKPRKMIVFCDVGQGDGAIIIDNNSQIIIDVGGDNGKMAECLSSYMPFWDREIEVVVISHWDGDHSGGLKKLQQLYRLGKIYSGTVPNDQIEQKYYSGDLEEGDAIRLGEILFEVKSKGGEKLQETSKENERSVIGVLSYGIYKVLFTGDATVEEERRLVWRGLISDQSTVNNEQGKRMLKVSHHGSNTGTSEELLEVFKPETAIISVGKNKFGHPNKEVLERLEKMGVGVRRTDREGDIVVQVTSDQ